MGRIDIAKLRKRGGLSQRELAERLEVRPSFLSAIENGRSRLPEDKLDKLKEIFEIGSFDNYMIDDIHEAAVPPHTHLLDQGDSLTQLLNHFHELAHRRTTEHQEHDEGMSERIDFLTRRNDRLSERVDDLREEVDRLREDNLRLKELLVRNGITY